MDEIIMKEHKKGFYTFYEDGKEITDEKMIIRCLSSLLAEYMPEEEEC